VGDSLVIDGKIELLAGGAPSPLPECLGATFRLQDPYDLGAGQPTTDVVASMLLDGERIIGDRTSNRTISLPILVDGTSYDNLAAARETLLKLIDQPNFTLTWTRNGTPAPLDQLGNFAAGLDGGTVFQAVAAQRSQTTLTGDDATFANSIGHWIAVGNTPVGTVARSTAQGIGGAAGSLLITAGTGSCQAAPVGTGYSQWVPCVANDKITATGYFRADAVTGVAGRICQIGIWFTDGSGAFLAAPAGGNMAVTNDGWI
jgi:hypothetical protein